MNAKLAGRRRKKQTKESLEGFRCSIPADLAAGARGDAVKFNKPLDGICKAIFRHYFSLKREEREKLCVDIPAKLMGRKVAV